MVLMTHQLQPFEWSQITLLDQTRQGLFSRTGHNHEWLISEAVAITFEDSFRVKFTHGVDTTLYKLMKSGQWLDVSKLNKETGLDDTLQRCSSDTSLATTLKTTLGLVHGGT